MSSGVWRTNLLLPLLLIFVGCTCESAEERAWVDNCRARCPTVGITDPEHCDTICALSCEDIIEQLGGSQQSCDQLHAPLDNPSRVQPRSEAQPTPATIQLKAIGETGRCTLNPDCYLDHSRLPAFSIQGNALAIQYWRQEFENEGQRMGTRLSVLRLELGSGEHRSDVLFSLHDDRTPEDGHISASMHERLRERTERVNQWLVAGNFHSLSRVPDVTFEVHPAGPEQEATHVATAARFCFAAIGGEDVTCRPSAQRLGFRFHHHGRAYQGEIPCVMTEEENASVHCEFLTKYLWLSADGERVVAQLFGRPIGRPIGRSTSLTLYWTAPLAELETNER